MLRSVIEKDGINTMDWSTSENEHTCGFVSCEGIEFMENYKLDQDVADTRLY